MAGALKSPFGAHDCRHFTDIDYIFRVSPPVEIEDDRKRGDGTRNRWAA